MIFSTVSIFINQDIKDQLTGIEHASLLRATLFENKTGIPPVVTTLKFNPFTQYYAQKHKNSGRYSKQLNIVNIWDVLLENLEDKSHYKPKNKIFELKEKNKTKEQNINIKKIYFEDTEIIEQTDFFNNDIKIKSQLFHWLGHICCEKEYDGTETTIKSTYFSPQGKPIILEIPNQSNNKENLKPGFYLFIEDRLAPNKKLVEYIGNFDSLIKIALLRLIKNQHNQNIVLIIDKNIVAYRIAIMIRDKLKQEGKRIYVISNFHSTHYNGFNQNGKIKRHYKNVLEYKKKSADHIVCLTKQQQKDLQARFPNQSINYIPHTFNQNMVSKKHEIQPNIVYIARLSPEKNHIEALQIFDLVLKTVRNAQLHIYGTGPKKEEIISKIKEMKLSNHVFLKGYVDSVERIYQSACLSISTSKIEGFGLSILESLASGCPCIAYDVNYGPNDIIDSGLNGFLIKPGAQVEFSKKIISLLTNHELRNQFSKNAQETIANKFSEDRVFSLWKELYKTLTPDLPITINGEDVLITKQRMAAHDLHSYHRQIQEKHNSLLIKTWVYKNNIAVVDFVSDDLQIAIDNIIDHKNLFITVFGRNDFSIQTLKNAACVLGLPYANDKNKHIVFKQPFTDRSLVDMRKASKFWFEKLHQWLSSISKL